MIFVCSKFDKIPPNALSIDTTSKGGVWSQLSPFKLGPCKLYDSHTSQTMENAWQFSKVYEKQINKADWEPLPSWWKWAKQGWEDTRAHRYPMGKAAIPLYLYWKGAHLD